MAEVDNMAEGLVPVIKTPEKRDNDRIISGESKVFNDPIHGHISLHPLLVAIIDTPQFQRLRYIKQLGGGYYVFPGASHNRFEHSIGVSYLAGEFLKTLRENHEKDEKPLPEECMINDKDILCAEIAGLCHDLGHGPFSHLFDIRFIPKSKGWKHEDASKDMLDHLIYENNLKPLFKKYHLDDEDVTFIKEMIDPPKKSESGWQCKGRPKEKGYMYEIVANKMYGIDVDKWDYFARDCHCLGIANNFDYRRYIAFARIVKVEGSCWQICCRDKEAHNLYEMFHTRYTLHRRAYQHKTKVAIEIMITDALKAADEYLELPGKDGKVIMTESIRDMKAYSLLTDSILQTIMMQDKQELKEAQEIIQKLHKRQHYKYLGRVIVNKELNEESAKTGIFEHKPSTSTLEKSEIHIAIVNFGYCMKDKSTDPFEKMRFFRKDDPYTAIRMAGVQVSAMFPKEFEEKQVFLYCEDGCEKKKRETVTKCFRKWCDEQGYAYDNKDCEVFDTPYANPGSTKKQNSSAQENDDSTSSEPSNSQPDAKSKSAKRRRLDMSDLQTS